MIDAWSPSGGIGKWQQHLAIACAGGVLMQSGSCIANVLPAAVSTIGQGVLSVLFSRLPLF